MNQYLDDAKYNFKRCASILDGDTMSREQIEDAVLFFAFAVERAFKATLHDVNSLFVLEGDSFDDAFHVLYRKRLHGKHRDRPSSDVAKHGGLNENVIAY